MADAANDVRDRTVTLGGEPIVVRELRYGQVLSLYSFVSPLVDGFTKLLKTGGTETTFAEVEQVIAGNAEAWLQLTAASVERDSAWVAGLTDADAQRLANAFWEANGPWLVRRSVMSGLDNLLRTLRDKAREPEHG
jgi:hypothetical protein